METTAQFDLNRAIESWRANLAQSPALRDENLYELETHLRDLVGELETRGLSQEEAFIVATRRIGKSSSLENEFSKVNSNAIWIDRVLWMLIGLQVWGLVSAAVGSVSNSALSLALVSGGFDFKAHGKIIPAILFSVAQLLAIGGSLAICRWLIVFRGKRLGSKLGEFLHDGKNLSKIYMLFFFNSIAGYNSKIRF